MENQRQGQGTPVCKNCGAVCRPGSLHCVFCGAVLEAGMTLPRYTAVPEGIGGKPVFRPRRNPPNHQRVYSQPQQGIPREETVIKPAVTVLGIISLAIGILAVLTMALSQTHSGIGMGIAAVILGIVSLGRRKGGGVLSGTGLGLGLFVLLTQGFWFFAPWFMLF